MGKTYRDAVTEAKNYLESKIALLTDQAVLQDVRDIIFAASIFGLQRITDIAFWLQDALTSQEATPLDTQLLPEIRATLREILDAWELPNAYGEFVKMKDIALRPIFTRKVNIRNLVEKLSQNIKPQWDNRVSFKLSVSVASGFPYALRVPTRFISRADEEYALSLVYIDWNHQPMHSWIDGAKLLSQWESGRELLYHGALEVPSQVLLERKDILPYYALLRLKESGDAFLRRAGLQVHSLQLLGAESYQDDCEDLPMVSTSSLLKEATKLRLRLGKMTSVRAEKEEVETEGAGPPPSQRSKPSEQLSLIPFRVEDLANPSFPWPSPPSAIKMLEPQKIGVGQESSVVDKTLPQ